MTQAPATQKPSPAELEAVLRDLRPRLSPGAILRRQEPIALRTTLKVGGPAEAYFEPDSEEDLAAMARVCHAAGIPITMIGRGSNLLVRDHGIRGVVICLAREHFATIEISGSNLVAGAGARLKAVAASAKRHELGGFEFMDGIPGTVGGALRMNAGAMGSSMFDLVQSVRLMNLQGEITEKSASELDPHYRHCEALRTQVALRARFLGVPAPKSTIQARMDEFNRKRWASQPAAPSAGCIFKNPPGIPAGKLIDELGLKGTRVGGAIVAAEHGNFIINEGEATAEQVLALIRIIQERAKTERGIDLETEVEILGE